MLKKYVKKFKYNYLQFEKIKIYNNILFRHKIIKPLKTTQRSLQSKHSQYTYIYKNNKFKKIKTNHHILSLKNIYIYILKIDYTNKYTQIFI